MDIVSFIFPNGSHKSTEQNVNNINTIKPEIKNDGSNNYYVNNPYNYFKLTNNVYKFGNKNISIYRDASIYTLETNARQLKESKQFQEAIILYKYILTNRSLELKSLKNIHYDVLINLALLTTDTGGDKNEIYAYYDKLISLFPDRAEPYHYYSIYCNKQHDYNKAFEMLTKALSLSYNESSKIYTSTNRYSYGKYLYDELAVACYWLKKYAEAKIYLEQIIDDPDLINERPRLQKNLEYTNNELIKIESIDLMKLD